MGVAPALKALNLAHQLEFQNVLLLMIAEIYINGSDYKTDVWEEVKENLCICKIGLPYPAIPAESFLLTLNPGGGTFKRGWRKGSDTF